MQRVAWARVKLEGRTTSEIGPGLLLLLGAGEGDTDADVEHLARKIVHLRIFEDERHNMNRSLLEVGGGLLLVSQFTLYGDCRKGRRPSFIAALEPGQASRLCDLMAARCAELGVQVVTGKFGAMMDVELCNSGPVTLLLDSRRQF